MKKLLLLAAAAAVGVPVAGPITAQLPIPAANARVRAALDIIKADSAWTLQQQIELTQIPAPPFKESVRGAEYKRRLEALGFTNVIIDPAGNVIAERKGAGNGPTVVIAGHLDTVFPEGTNVTVKHDGAKLRAPGIGDDGRGLTTVLSVARAFQKAGVQTNGTIYFIGDVGEEGPGNLRGMRQLFGNTLKGRIDYFISVDDTELHVVSRAVGSNRYKITYKGPGGHSYGAFGIPNPIHALGRAIAGIADIQVPATPKTTFNVGVISGGTSVNSIPYEGVDGSGHALRGCGLARRDERQDHAHRPRRARRRERAVARAARGGGKAVTRHRHDRHSAHGRPVGQCADRAHRARCRQGAWVLVGHVGVEHRLEHSDQPVDPGDHDRRRRARRGRALARRVVRGRAERVPRRAVGGAIVAALAGVR